MRNPKWHRDEIILALDLYFDPHRGSLDSRNPKVIALSSILSQLPLHTVRPDESTFRNPNGVSLKLSNFLHFDKTYTGKGMSGGSVLDEQVFNEFVNNKDELRKLAFNIKKVLSNSALKKEIEAIEDDEETLKDSVKEGQVLYKLHKIRERDHGIIKAKKKYVLKQTGKLLCEACNFDFEKVYGSIGQGYIECHHIKPLSTMTVEATTTIYDLALVCSNCHRMLHKGIDTLIISDIKNLISQNSK